MLNEFCLRMVNKKPGKFISARPVKIGYVKIEKTGYYFNVLI
jgi:hypothetical protein